MRPIGRIVAVAAAGTMALGLAACSTSTDTSKPAEEAASGTTATTEEAAEESTDVPKGDGTKTIYLVSKGFQHRFWQAVKEGAEQAGEEFTTRSNSSAPMTRPR